MKHIGSIAILLSLCLPLGAQETDGDKAQKARITAERGQAEAVFREEQKACYGNFAVNDCTAAARVKRRQVLSDLKRQEISLNDAMRRRQAAERVKSLDDRATEAAKREEEGRPTRSQPRADRQAATPQGKPRSSDAASAPQTARQPRQAASRQQPQERQAQKQAEKERNAQAAKDRRQQQQEKVEAATLHKADVENKMAVRKKPPASALAVPP